ncbi:uncharacterized protein LOC113305332 [Papaver somniferum]|uniref:uncharacterized protein LOC113305332 n=1 Tax=Papaver somniferum TaxID=3469 RepID=UPI000E6FAB7E|nr:uncharacterized protein LOC113305332 [Papaver somniferum]
MVIFGFDAEMATETPVVVVPSAQVVGNAFVEQYYHILHKSPELVYRFYQVASVLSQPGPNGVMSTVSTMNAINQKILSNSRDYKAEIKSADAQYPTDYKAELKKWHLLASVTVFITLLGADFMRMESLGKVEEFAETLVEDNEEEYEEHGTQEEEVVDVDVDSTNVAILVNSNEAEEECDTTNEGTLSS